MTLEEYARIHTAGEPQRATESHERPKQENYTAKSQNAIQGKFDPLENEWRLETARKICERYQVSRQATDGIMRQVLQDISQHKDPVLLILFLSEALDRSSGGGDAYIKQVEAALIENGYQSDALTL